MSFTIIAACTPNYSEMARLCVPSWVRNSGASKIIIERIEGTEGPRHTSWYDNVSRRCEAMCRNVVTALQAGERVLALDMDCIVLQDLSDGFNNGFPISIARWPDVNMGVMFFNPLVDFQFGHLLRRVTNDIKVNCDLFRGTLRPAGGCWLADQEIWQKTLAAMEDQVYKLDAAVWNFCPHLKDWETQWRKHKDTVKIVHLKGQGQTEKHRIPLGILRAQCPERI